MADPFHITYQPGQVLDHNSQPWQKEAGYEPGFALPHVITFGSIMSSAWKTYYPEKWDEALRNDRAYAMYMRNDAETMALLKERKFGTASLKWHIEVDNEKDPAQKAIKEGLTAVAKRVPHFQKLHMYMLETIWYGRYGSQLDWQTLACEMNLPDLLDPTKRTKRKAFPFRHQPINGDKIRFLWDGTPCIKVHSAWGSQIPKSALVKATDGWAVALKGTWRRNFIIHAHELEDADYWAGEAVDSIHGVGVRSTIHWLHWLKSEWLANVADWCERTGLGVRVWYYQGGNPKSEEAVKRAAEQQSDKTNLLVPRFPNQGGRNLEGVEYVDTNTGGAQLLLELQKHIGEVIERYIVGQSLSSGTEGSGLGGSGVASLHSATKQKIIAFDANNLAETYTEDVFRPLARWMYPDVPEIADIPIAFVFDVDDQDPDKKLDAIGKAVSFGMQVKESDVQGLLGLEAPQEGDKVLGGGGGQPGMPGQPQGQDDDTDLPEDEDGERDHAADAERAFPQPKESDGYGTYEGYARDGEVLRYGPWDESKHPRNKGQFASKGGESNPAELLSHVHHFNSLIDRIQAARKHGKISEEATVQHAANARDKAFAAVRRHALRERAALEARGGATPEALASLKAKHALLSHYLAERSLHPLHGAGRKERDTVRGQLSGTAARLVDRLEQAHAKAPVSAPVAPSGTNAAPVSSEPRPPVATPAARPEAKIKGPSRMSRQGQPERYEVQHAPHGGVTIQGQFFPGGEFIPSEVLAKATPEEKQQLTGKGKSSAAHPRVKAIKDESRKIPVTNERVDGGTGERVRRSDYRGIEREMTDEERSEFEDRLVEMKDNAIDSMMNEESFEPDWESLANAADWNDGMVAKRADEEIGKLDDDELDSEAPDEERVRLEQLTDKWLQQTSQSGPEAVLELADYLKENDASPAVIRAVKDLRQDADRDIEAAKDKAEDEWREERRTDLANDYDDSKDRVEYLRDFWDQHAEEPRYSGAGEKIFDQWGKDADGDSAMFFTTGEGREYQITVFPRSFAGKDMQELVFQDANGSFEVTGAGGAHEVFRKVVAATAGWVGHEKPEALSFTAAEPSRQKLYDRLVRTTAAVEPDYRAFAIQGQNAKRYLLVRRDKVDDYEKAATATGANSEVLVYAKAPVWTELTAGIDESWFTPEGWADDPARHVKHAPEGFDDGSEPVRYAAAHAPAGGISIGGQQFTGGEFIPGSVMAKATAAEREAVTKPAKPKAAPANKEEAPKGIAYQAKEIVRKIKPTKKRAFEGKPVEATKISKQLAGAIGEEIVIQHLKSQGFADARHLNMERNNFPIDLVQDHESIEVKTGQVSNGPGAWQWRMTIGEPGKEEKAWLAQASDEEKAAWNAKKQAAITERKKKALAEVSKKVGKSVKAKTMTVLLNPDTKTADLYMFSGWHDRIAWNSDAARKAYIGSVQYA